MQKPNKIEFVLIAIVTVTVAGLIVTKGIDIVTNPLRRSEDTIRESLLSEVPLGSTGEEVLRFIEQHENWRLHDAVTYAHPFAGSTGGELARTRRVHMGRYRSFFYVDVSAFWRFDEDGKLFYLIVIKTADAL